MGVPRLDRVLLSKAKKTRQAVLTEKPKRIGWLCKLLTNPELVEGIWERVHTDILKACSHHGHASR